MSEHDYGHLPPKNDDGSYKQVAGRFGFWTLYSDGTFLNHATGNVHDPEDIGSGGSSSDTRVDIEDDNTSIQSDASVLDFKSYLSAAADGNGGADITVDLPSVSDSGTVVLDPFEDLNFGTYLSAASDGSGGADISVTLPSVSDGGTVVLDPFEDLNFGPEFSVADDGDQTATITTNDDVIRTRQAQIPLTEIADTNTAVGLQMQVPSGKTLKVLEVGVQDDTESAPAGLTVEVQDVTNATSLVSQNAKHAEGSPLASKSGAIDVQFRVANSTGGSINASGYVLYTME